MNFTWTVRAVLTRYKAWRRLCSRLCGRNNVHVYRQKHLRRKGRKRRDIDTDNDGCKGNDRKEPLAIILYNFCHIITRKRSFHAITWTIVPFYVALHQVGAPWHTNRRGASEKRCVIMLRHRRRRQVADCIGPGEFLAFRHVLLSNTLYRVAYFNPLFSDSERTLRARKRRRTFLPSTFYVYSPASVSLFNFASSWKIIKTRLPYESWQPNVSDGQKKNRLQTGDDSTLYSAHYIPRRNKESQDAGGKKGLG